MKHIDLFSGIGGFALAAEAVWGNQVEHIFSDNDPFCQAILKKHWPKAKIYGDIRTLTADSYRDRCTGGDQEVHATNTDEQTQRRTARRSTPPFILTGGFPCQPFSQAGRRKGTEDDRFLWPEMLRVIREFRPQWVIGENVAGLLTISEGLVFQQVCTDLEAENYEVQPFVIPAVAVNAPHRRDRVWIVAHRTSERPDIRERDREERHILRNENGDASESEPEWNGRKRGIGTIGSDAPNATREGLERGRGAGKGLASNALNPTGKRFCGRGEDENRQQSKMLGEGLEPSWESNWLEVASALCDVAYGLPAELVRPDGERDRNYPWWRTQALKAGGNSIVPQVAIEIMRGIKLTQENE